MKKKCLWCGIRLKDRNYCSTICRASYRFNLEDPHTEGHKYMKPRGSWKGYQ